MMKVINHKHSDVDFKLPCSEKTWQRFLEYKKRINKSYTPSLYWRQREESFEIIYSEGFVYLTGLYKRNLNKEVGVGNLLQRIQVKLNLYSRIFLRKLFFNKSKYPSPFFKTKEQYINNRIKKYNTKYKKIVKTLLGDNYDINHEDVYAKHMDIISCLENQLSSKYRRSFVEIGSGSGVLAFLLINRLGFKKANLVDLPVMIPVCFFWLCSISGEETVALPGDRISSKVIYRLWNAGDAPIEYSSNDLAINVTSFQEMNHKLVKDYFKLIKKWLKPNGFFMCVNRWVKATDFWLYPYSIFKESKIILFDEDLTSRHSSMKKIIVRKLIQL